MSGGTLNKVAIGKERFNNNINFVICKYYYIQALISQLLFLILLGKKKKRKKKEVMSQLPARIAFKNWI